MTITLHKLEPEVAHELAALQTKAIAETGDVDVSGAIKFDAGKPRFDLIPPDVMFELAKLYEMGARKYADRNWEAGMGWGRIFRAMLSHAWKWWMGEERDPDGQHHLDSVIWCAMALRAYVLRGIGTDTRNNLRMTEKIEGTDRG